MSSPVDCFPTCPRRRHPRMKEPEKKPRKMPTWLRYSLFQIPGALICLLLLLLAVLEMEWIQTSTAGGIFLLWLAKDALMYPFVRKSYEDRVKTGKERLIGQKGATLEELNPEGYIRVSGELWKARSLSQEKIHSDTTVVIRGYEGMQLEVEESEEE